MLSHSQRRQRGVTLVELMIGLTVGLLVIAVVGTLFLTSVRGSNDSLSSMKLNQELRAAMNLMVSDIRRAGYWSGAATVNTPGNTPYMVRTNPATDVFVSNGCIRYTYDTDEATSAFADEVPERFGYRLQNGVIEMPQDTGLGTTNGTNDGCAEGNWEALTDANTVNITQLSFTTEGSQCRNLNVVAPATTPPAPWSVPAGGTVPACDQTVTGYTANTGNQLVEIRQIRIQLSGTLANDPTTSMTIDETVRLPNNRVLQAP